MCVALFGCICNPYLSYKKKEWKHSIITGIGGHEFCLKGEKDVHISVLLLPNHPIALQP